MKRILWLSNCVFSDDKPKATGTWQIAMGRALESSPEIAIASVSYAPVDKPIRRDSGAIRQWLLPQESLDGDGRPSASTRREISRIVAEFAPDLVHVWGTENFGGALVAGGHIACPALLEMQGILFAYAHSYYGGLDLPDLIGCIGPKELLLPWRHLVFRRRQFFVRGRAEHRVIRSFAHVAAQSAWVESHVRHVNPDCRIHPTGILLRREFMESPPWEPSAGDTPPRIFSTSSGSNSYKGLHVLVRAFARILRAHPGARLRIGGGIHSGRLPDGYNLWLLRLARSLGVADAIDWLGPLDAGHVCEELRAASVFVVPSFAETYCLALAEAMAVGTPCAVSFAGAMPELARHEESALYFPPGDAAACAAQVGRILSSSDFAASISAKARSTGRLRNDPGPIVDRQLAIYREILG